MSDAPRWLDRDACAEYISVRVDELPRLVKRGLLPAPSYHLSEPELNRPLSFDAAALRPKGRKRLARLSPASAWGLTGFAAAARAAYHTRPLARHPAANPTPTTSSTAAPISSR